LQVLRERFPHNRLLWLETGATTLRAGRPRDALVWLDEGMSRLPADTRPRSAGEMATWHLKRGSAYALLGDAARAGADAKAAAGEAAARWVRGRVAILEGQVADLQGRRPDALAAYRRGRELCRSGNDPVGVQQAERWLDNVFRGTSALPARQYN
jgi:predicted Zn-dependent protease